MIQKCSIENINSSMHYFGLIILAIIVCIVFIYYIKITNAEHQEIIERYSENTIEAPYLKTGELGNSQEQVHNYDAKLIDTTFPTLNSLATSTATLRPCQIHFNKDGTNKYVFEDGWKEMDEIKTGENTTYKVPYKIFGNNFNNDGEFINFTETSTCFKVKEGGKGKVNTYKYKSNDLIKYNLNSYVKIKETGGVENEYIQMNFVKQDANSADNYRSKAVDSICSYHYNPDLDLQNLKMHRFKINNKTDNNVEEINKVSIEDKNNHVVTVEKSLDYSELLGDNGSSYDFDSSGKITYTVKGFKGDYFIPVKIYKFNRNLLCKDEIKSYEVHNKQINTGLLIESSSFSETIHNANILATANISDADKAEIIRLENLLNFNDFKGNIEEYANSKLSNTYKMKEQLLSAMLHNTYKLIAKANIDIAKKYSEELNKNKEREVEANSFIDSINTIDKLIKTYLDIPKPSQLPILEKIIGTTERKLFYKNCAGIMDYKEQNIVPDRSARDNIEVVADVKNPIYETKIYRIDTADKTIRFGEDTVCEILLVGGGGGGGKNGGCEGGGGGGGGMIVHLKNFKLKSNVTYNITVGQGGAKSPGEKSDTMFGGNGGHTMISTLNQSEYVRAEGGGGGGPGKSNGGEVWGAVWDVPNAASGGSGGGGSAFGGGGGGGGRVDSISKVDDSYSNNGITVYSDPNYGGTSFVKNVGRYNMYGEPNIGLANDTLSSLRIPKGYKVTLYYHGDFGGATLVLTEDTPSLPTWMDNNASGYVVEKIANIDYNVYGNNGGGANHLGGGGGGGGAGGNGVGPNGNSGGKGGDGVNIPIFDNNYYGAGGGGSTGNSCQGNWASPTGHPAGKGGVGGGGDGGARAVTNGKDGLPHTGSGGGGSSYEYAGNGGSGIVIIKYIKKSRPNGANMEIVFNYNEDTRTKYEIMVKKSTFVTLDDTKQLELSEGPYTIIKNTAYKKGFIMIKKSDAKSTVTNIIHSNSLNQIKISSISADEEYLKRITDNKDVNLDSRAIIKSTVVDNSIMLNIGSKAGNYKKINIYLSYLTSSVDILNVIQNIKIEYSVQGSDKRQLLNRDANYTIFNIITDSSISFQKTTSFDIVFKSILNMDKIYMFLPKNKFYFLNAGSFPHYSKYLSDKVNEVELKNDIDKLFEIDKTSKKLNDLKMNRIYAITNENYKMEVKNNSGSNNSIALLQDAYNKVLDYDTKNKKVTTVFKKTDIVKVFGDKSGESISDIKSKYISYESPNPRTALSADEKYNIDKVSDNYIYFTIN